jgi:hypothetical protein
MLAVPAKNHKPPVNNLFTADQVQALLDEIDELRSRLYGIPPPAASTLISREEY